MTTITATASPPAVGSRPSSRRDLLILLLLCGAQFLVVLDATIVNVALPSIQRALGFTEQSLQWVASGYALTFAGFLLLGGETRLAALPAVQGFHRQHEPDEAGGYRLRWVSDVRLLLSHALSLSN